MLLLKSIFFTKNSECPYENQCFPTSASKLQHKKRGSPYEFNGFAFGPDPKSANALAKINTFNIKYQKPLRKSIFLTKNRECPYENQYFYQKSADAFSEIATFGS